MSYIHIDKKSFFYNLDVIKERVKKKKRIAIVLKDNAYGHGILEIAYLSHQYGIKTAIVRDIKEAQKISKFFKRIIILADISNKKLSKNLHKNLHITINSLDDINKIKLGNRVELKIDTGMNRQGIKPNEIEKAIKSIIKNGLILKGVFTHYHSADENNNKIYTQVRKFKKIKNQIKKLTKLLNIKTPYFHSLNSHSVFRLDIDDEKFARVGIASYGYLEGYLSKKFLLKPVLKLFTEKISDRILKKYDKVGYGAAYKNNSQDMIIGTYDIGYGDGFFRINEFQKYILPDGSKILGRVSMDNMCINSNKKELLLFDNGKKLAEIQNTIIYEILVHLKQNIKRLIV